MKSRIYLLPGVFCFSATLILDCATAQINGDSCIPKVDPAVKYVVNKRDDFKITGAGEHHEWRNATMTMGFRAFEHFERLCLNNCHKPKK